jgi:hypothetical protein
MNTNLKIALVLLLSSLLIGCSSGGDSAEDAKVNADVSTGPPPAKLQGSEGAGGGGTPKADSASTGL